MVIHIMIKEIQDMVEEWEKEQRLTLRDIQDLCEQRDQTIEITRNKYAVLVVFHDR